MLLMSSQVNVMPTMKTRGLSAWQLRCLIIHCLWYTSQCTPNEIEMTVQCTQCQMSWGTWKAIYHLLYMCLIQNWYDAPFRRYNILKVMWPWFDLERLSKVKCIQVNWYFIDDFLYSTNHVYLHRFSRLRFWVCV